jgi:hypothetical protein
VLLLVPFVLLIVGLRTLTEKYGVKLTISYYLGIAIGPLIADLFAVVSPIERRKMRRAGVSTFSLAPDVKAWAGYFPNPLRVLDRQQTMWTMVTAAVSSATFVFSPIAMTVILGELVGARIKHSYERLTTVIAVRKWRHRADVHRRSDSSADGIRVTAESNSSGSGGSALQRTTSFLSRCCHRSYQQSPYVDVRVGVSRVWIAFGFSCRTHTRLR